MRVIAAIDQRAVVEKLLRHLGQWNGTPLLAPARAPPDGEGPWTRSPHEMKRAISRGEPCNDVDSMPDYENVLSD